MLSPKEDHGTLPGKHKNDYTLDTMKDFYCPQGNTALLISGGVDSAVAVHLMCERGVKPHLFYIKIGMEGEDYSCSSEEDMELSQLIARKYGLQLDVIDLQEAYWSRVVEYVVDRVRRGFTPNSDVMCNKLVKFGAFEEQVGKDFDYIVTGHYARMGRDGAGQLWMYAGVDPVKDQSDFLAQLERFQVEKAVFPLGALQKSEVRRIAQEQHLPCAHRKDSQGICFLGKINYRQFLTRLLGEKEGEAVDIETGKRVGLHKGYWLYTLGQRKGLGFGGGPWYVVKKDVEQNILYVAHGYETSLQYGKRFHLEDFHVLTANPFDAPGEYDIRFKIRHTELPIAGKLLHTTDGWAVESSEPLQGIAPGQFGVVYVAEGQRCIGSGEIRL